MTHRQKTSHRLRAGQITFTIAITLLIHLTGVAAHADLILNIDTSNEEFFFTGSDTITLNGSEVVWRIGPSNSPSTSINLSSAIDIAGNTPISPSQLLQLSGNRTSVYYEFISTGNPTFTGNGTRLSYALASNDEAAFLEGLIGSSIPLVQGTGGAPIQVQGVPEPSSFLLLPLALVALAIKRQRTTNKGLQTKPSISRIDLR